MATVTVIREEVKPVVPPIKEVVLTMSEEQAILLRGLLAKVGGCGPRKDNLQNIAVALQNAGICYRGYHQNGLAHDFQSGSILVKY